MMSLFRLIICNVINNKLIARYLERGDMMDIIWTDTRIREEIKQLDQKTGLLGATLPIKFNNSNRTLGSFCSASGQPKMFCFSNHYFQNPSFSVEEAVDCIRHEYAHYMDLVINKRYGHSPSWRQCCLQIGTLPSRYYTPDYYRKKHEREQQENHRIDRFAPGVTIEHPKFGYGTVLSHELEGNYRMLRVSFQKEGTKLLGATWVLNNCRRL